MTSRCRDDDLAEDASLPWARTSPGSSVRWDNTRSTPEHRPEVVWARPTLVPCLLGRRIRKAATLRATRAPASPPGRSTRPDGGRQPQTVGPHAPTPWPGSRSPPARRAPGHADPGAPGPTMPALRIANLPERLRPHGPPQRSTYRSRTGDTRESTGWTRTLRMSASGDGALHCRRTGDEQEIAVALSPIRRERRLSR